MYDLAPKKESLTSPRQKFINLNASPPPLKNFQVQMRIAKWLQTRFYKYFSKINKLKNLRKPLLLALRK